MARVLSVLCATGIVFAQPPAKGPPKQEIEQLREAWGRYLHAKQLDLAVDLYASDAVFFEPAGKRISGKVDLRKLFATVMQTYDSEIRFENSAVDVSGDLAYEGGDYQEMLVRTATGTRVELRGSYLMVLRRDANGRWHIAQHMWTVAPPPAP